jgi:serine/threonine protein kinase
LKHIASAALFATGLTSVVLPPFVRFIARDALPDRVDSSLFGSDFLGHFLAWKTSSPRSDYVRDETVRPRHLCELVHDASEFVSVEGSHVLRHCTAGYLVSVKRAAGVTPAALMKAFREIEALAALDHPCIAPFAGYCIARRLQEVQIATLFLPERSLDDVISSQPAWWTPTVKAIAVTGIVLGMSEVHSAGLIHRDLRPPNIQFDIDHRPRIGGFGESRRESLVAEAEEWSPTFGPYYTAPDADYCTKAADVYSFALILYEIVVGEAVFPTAMAPDGVRRKWTANERRRIPPNVPKFVGNLIKGGWSPTRDDRPSFQEIFEELEANKFAILDGVDSGEVTAFSTWVRAFGLN